jgi:hypothetical protein
MYFIQHCVICCPSNSTVSEDAGIEPRTVATLALAVRRSNLSARSHPLSARFHLYLVICILIRNLLPRVPTFLYVIMVVLVTGIIKKIW